MRGGKAGRKGTAGGEVRVQAERAGAEGGDLQQLPGEHHVLEEMHEAVLVGEVAVEVDCRQDRQ